MKMKEESNKNNWCEVEYLNGGCGDAGVRRSHWKEEEEEEVWLEWEVGEWQEPG